MRNTYRILVTVVIVAISLLVISFANYSSFKTTPTGNFVLLGGSLGLVAGFGALIPFVYVYWKEKRTLSQPSLSTETDVGAAADLYKIRGVLERYGSKKKVDFYAIQGGILEYSRDLFYNHHAYLDKHGSMGQYIKDIVTSSNPGAHGHFNMRRGEGYIIGLFKDLGLYHLIKYKI